jgi:hypothetical protein
MEHVLTTASIFAASPPIRVTVNSAGPNWVTLIIAIAGVVLSIGSLCWQAYTFVLSGGRIRIEVKIGGFGDHGFVQLMENADLPVSLPSLKQAGFEPIVVATIFNTGRMSIVIQQCSWATKDKALTSSPIGKWPATQLPCRLEPHDRCVCIVELKNIIGWITDEEGIWPIVELGSGQNKSGNPIKVSRELVPMLLSLFSSK